MFGELPKIFDRNFAIAFFLPVAAFVAASLGLVDRYNLFPTLLPRLQTDLLIGTTLLGLATWTGAIFLLVLNRDIYRLFEGYWRLNPFGLFIFLERWYYRRLEDKIAALENRYISETSEGSAPPAHLENERARLLQKQAERFPDGEWLLPTAFGNTMRAFEVYSRTMYGLDAIPGWSRLLSVISSDYLKLIDDAKAQTDFWLNLRLLSYLFILEYVGVSFYTRNWDLFWLLLLAFVFSIIAAWRARSAAVEWGELVKAAFDIYLPKLLTKLQFTFPETKEQEQELWQKVSQAIIYRIPEQMPVRIKTKAESDSDLEKKS